MDIERLKNKILYIAMLISVAMIFLTMHNSLDYSYEEQEFVIAILIPIMYIVINICMYLIFCNIETKKHIRSIGVFYLIVFVFSFIDILIFEKYRGSLIEDSSVFISKILISSFFALTLFISNISLIYHVNKYKREKRSALNFFKKLLLYAIECSIPFFLELIAIILIAKFVFREDFVFGEIITNLPALMPILLVILIISIIVFIITFFISRIRIKESNVRCAIALVTSMAFIIAPIYVLRENLLKPIENFYQAAGNDISLISDLRDDINYKQKEKSSAKLDEKYKKESIKNYLEKFHIASNIKNANEGEIVKFGKTFLKTNPWSKEDNYYFVYKKEGNELTLLSLYIIDKLENDDLMVENGEYRYKTYLDTTFYENAFTRAEKKMIVEKTYEDGRKHKVYVPNYKYYLRATKDFSDDVIGFVYANTQVFEKYVKSDGDTYNINFGIVLSETKLKKDNIRVANYEGNTFGIEYYNSVRERSILDLVVNEYSSTSVECYLRPVITVDISR
ncbi:MAG: hypothetical protein IKI71_04860 [Lachnospiraceae bacterium]|nr:hypothetical protein [Lachnospiraceae bacterium]